LHGRGEKAFVRGCSLLYHRRWVFGVGVLLPPSGVVCHAGQVREGVWCVAPSLTLVLEPLVLARRHDDRLGVPASGCGRFVL
jgi:hypothetical protein